LSTSAPTKSLIVVGGPTASGKTSLAIQLAQHWQTEIISADSRQFYKELNVGVAKPSKEELALVQHHFVGHKSIQDYYSAGEFERDVLSLLETLFKKHDKVIMVGGSGLFINAVLHGFHAAPKDDGTIRNEIDEIYTQSGVQALVDKLTDIDPEYAVTIDHKNPQRLMRAIERVMLTGKRHKEQTKPERAKRPFKAIEIAIDHDRNVLYERINKRVDEMINEGLVAEVESFKQFKDLNALQTVGYSELFNHFAGKTTLEEAIEKIKQNTRRYAKRQVTWFRNKSESIWFKPSDLNKVIAFIEEAGISD
jgi:tRNA dimethylallyltransferase